MTLRPRRTPSVLTTAVALTVVVLAGCSSPTPGPGAETPAAAPTSASPSPTPAPEAPATEIAADVLLPAAAWEPAGPAGAPTPGVTDWRLPESCAVGAPATASAMLGVEHGDGALESSVGVQQVAVFADADAAVAEADRVAAALARCAADPGAPSRYVVEPLAVGAQGLGLATDYYGTEGDVSTAIGTYLALTRRGTAVTLVSAEGGESNVGAAREELTARAGAAWELLCTYDAEGC